MPRAEIDPNLIQWARQTRKRIIAKRRQHWRYIAGGFILGAGLATITLAILGMSWK